MSENIDDLLDATLDDLEDLPAFEPYAPGAHKVVVNLELKEINGKPCVELSMKAIETLELADPTGEALKEGDATSLIYDLTNQFGQGAWKAVAKPLAEALGTSTTRELIEQCKEVECVVLTSLRKDKNDPDRKYTNIKQLQVV